MGSPDGSPPLPLICVKVFERNELGLDLSGFEAAGLVAVV